MTEWGYAGGVFVALVATLVAPAWAVARRMLPRERTETVVLTALLLGAGSQALMGFAWDRALLRHPTAAAMLSFVLWGVLTIGIGIRRGAADPAEGKARDKGFPLVLLILLGAVLVRSLHPVAHAALGQSDAYGHLQFLRQAAGDGFLHNRVYPPGFAWIMALPTLTFGLDPYHVARYAGAFWGAAMTLGVLVLAGRGDRKVGYLAGALAAFCPLLMPLLKTGVGLFANQFGLFMIPALLHANLSLARRHASLALALGAAALSVTVPMMLIALAPVLALDRLLAWAVRVPGARRAAGAALVAFLPALILLLFQAVTIRGVHREVTVAILTEQPAQPAASTQPPAHDRDRTAQTSGSPVRRLLNDYLSVKRVGYGRGLYNLAGVTLAAAFLAMAGLGLRYGRPEWRLLGLFGLVTSMQAGFGLLQFSAYQREGWSLLLATAWLGGVAGDRILAALPARRRLPERLALAVCLLFFAVALRFPPGHPWLFSRAENQIVRIVRMQAAGGESDARPIMIVARAFTGFAGAQGDPLRAVIAPSPRIRTLSVDSDKKLDGHPLPGWDYLVLVDLEPLTEQDLPPVFAHVQSEAAAHHLREHRRLFELNQRIEAWLEALPDDEWAIQSVRRDRSIRVYFLRPRA